MAGMSLAETRLLLLADTHIPPRARAMPAQVWEEVARADVVLHAGDWTEESVLDELEARSRRMAESFPDVDVLVFGHSHIP